MYLKLVDWVANVDRVVAMRWKMPPWRFQIWVLEFPGWFLWVLLWVFNNDEFEGFKSDLN
jgi:hypothetical protein